MIMQSLLPWSCGFYPYNRFSLFCLECNKSCSSGELDTALCQCTCPDGVIQGRVVTSSGAPLRDVGILLELFPYTEVARTNKSGHFSMIDRCENKSYTVKKNDYIPLRLEGDIRGANPLLIRLEDAGALIDGLGPSQRQFLFFSQLKCK